MREYGDHSCYNKARIMESRIGSIGTDLSEIHSIISYICEEIWKCSEQSEFYEHMARCSNAELKEILQKAKDAVTALKRHAKRTDLIYA